VKIGILGATGFIGSHLLKYLASQGVDCVAFSRKSINDDVEHVSWINIDQSSNQDDFGWLDQGIDVLIDCAGAAEVRCSEKSLISLIERDIAFKSKILKNCELFGVGHYIYFSSIKVYGESSSESYFDESSPLNPTSAYGRMKLEIEREIFSKAKFSKTIASILRIPLVYDKDKSKSFLTLLNFLRKGVWLPFSGVKNSRSVLAVSNLCTFIEKLINHSPTQSAVWCVTDQLPVSTRGLIELLANYHGLKAKFFYMPNFIMWTLLNIIGRKVFYDKLYNNLLVNDFKSATKLDWKPTTNIEIELIRADD